MTTNTSSRTLSLKPGTKRSPPKKPTIDPKAVVPLFLIATILTKDGAVQHQYEFDWTNLNHQWPFKVRCEDVLRKGFGVLLVPANVDPEKLAELACQYPMHG